MSTTIRARTARVAHRCEDCRKRAILPGHRYELHTVFPGHDVMPVDRPMSLKRCLSCSLRYDNGADLTAKACGTFCCGDEPCAKPFKHGDNHSCRTDAEYVARDLVVTGTAPSASEVDRG